ncbi:MAG: LysR family transcriptional regulator [Curvibacter sp.]|nr:LysR family transcriptional regulator [Curvibacter sp.]
MNLRQLEVFQAVLQTGNMSAAGRLLCITPSAVSKAIAHTELQLGYRLFTRSPSGLSPTPEAQVLAAESRQIHRQLEGLRLTARNLAHREGGQIRVAAIPSITHEFLPELLQLHASRHPQVGIEVRTLNQDQMAQALLTHSVDFCLGFYPHPHPQLSSELLISGRLFLVVSRELWARAVRGGHPQPYGRLGRMPVIRLVGDDPMRQSIDLLAERLGVAPGPGLQVQTSRLAVELVRRGMGWTVVDFLTARRLDTATMVALELHELPSMALYSYHSPSTPPGQQVRRLLDMMQPLLHQMPHSD